MSDSPAHTHARTHTQTHTHTHTHVVQHSLGTTFALGKLGLL